MSKVYRGLGLEFLMAGYLSKFHQSYCSNWGFLDSVKSKRKKIKRGYKDMLSWK